MIKRFVEIKVVETVESYFQVEVDVNDDDSDVSIKEKAVDVLNELHEHNQISYGDGNMTHTFIVKQVREEPCSFLEIVGTEYDCNDDE